MKHFIFALALICLAVPASRAEDQATGKVEKLSILRADGQKIDLDVEIADTLESRTIGLMFRKSMPRNAGMLFLFEREEPRAFWMKNTLIPLDMIFVRSDGSIVNIAEKAIPHDETPVPSTGPAIAVLEINGGRAAELGLKAGDVIHYKSFNNGLAEPAPIH